MTARLEQALQREVCKLLDAILANGAMYFAIPNGGARSRVEAAIMRGLGTKAGMPDLCILYCGRAWFVELKAPLGRLSAAQIAMRETLRAAECPVAIVRSLDDMLGALRRWPVPHRPVHRPESPAP